MSDQAPENTQQQADEKPAPAKAQNRPLPANATVADLRAALNVVDDPPPGPNATTDPPDPAQHFYLAPDGKTRINAWGEEKGSPEDKKRFS